MRMMSPLLASTLCLAIVAPAEAQNPPPQTKPPTPAQPAPASDVSSPSFGGQIDFGFRGTIYGSDSDQARYQRYRDLRNGAIADAFRAGRDAGAWSFDVRADHIGYRDQRYLARYTRPGKLHLSFEFNQIPLFFSTDTATPYTSQAQGTLVLPDATQNAIQGGTQKLADYVPISPQFDLEMKRSITDVRLTYNATPTVDLLFSFRDTTKKGEQQWAGTFGFSNAVEFPVPVDTNTADLGAAAEWMNDRAELRVGYDGSYFRNNTDRIVWDNPLRLSDSSSSGPAQGRLALWPNSNQNTGSLSGLVKLARSSVGTAYVSLSV